MAKAKKFAQKTTVSKSSKSRSKTPVVKKTISSAKAFGDTTEKQSWLKKWSLKILSWLAWPFVKVYKVLSDNRKASPHKSFQMTRRRDLPKRPKLEGYVAFPWYVARILWRDKWLFMRLLMVFLVLSALTSGTVQMANMGTVNEAVGVIDDETDGQVLEPVTKAFAVVGASLLGSLNANMTDTQFLLFFAIGFFLCIVVVWLLRQRQAGNRVNVRDGLYNSGSPILSLYVLVIVGVLQLIPLALLTLVYSAAVSGGVLSGGIDTAMFSIALFMALVLTLYFMTTTLFAIFIATIPGTYPLVAYQTARRIVAGQRARLLFRLLWLALIVAVLWFMVLVPVVIMTNSLGGQDSLVIPLAVQTVTGASLVYASAYAYLLYRRMIDDPTE